MAIGDKLVNLDELKVAYDKLVTTISQQTSERVNKSGDVMTGPLVIGSTTSTDTKRLRVRSNVSNNFGEVELRADSAGGNIKVSNGDKNFTIDFFDGTTFRLYSYDDDNNFRSLRWNRNTGVLSAKVISAEVPASNITGVLDLSHGGLGASTASGARTALDVYSKSEIWDILAAEVYNVKGLLVRSPTSGTALGYGKATISIVGKLVKIDFAVKIETAGTKSDVYDIGIQVSYIRNLDSNIPYFRVINGGHIHYYTPSGALDVAHEGYSGETNANMTGNYWTFGRMYTQSGSFGSWSDNIYELNEYIIGTVYGAIQ